MSQGCYRKKRKDEEGGLCGERNMHGNRNDEIKSQ